MDRVYAVGVGESFPAYDVFISYHWQDHSIVEPIARALDERGLKVFLDRWYLVPGQSWVGKLEETIRSCKSAAVFIGADGLGRWQQRERDLALNRQAQYSTFPDIPVLLHGAQPGLVPPSISAHWSRSHLFAAMVPGERPS